MTTIERCDQCIQVARFQVEMNAGSLYFCNHHYQKAAIALMEMAEAIHELENAAK